MHIRLDATTATNRIVLERGVKQGDTIPPKLCTLAQEEVFKNLEWDTKGISVDGIRLNHLRFADNIVLIGKNITELDEMLNELHLLAAKIELNINFNKTKEVGKMKWQWAGYVARVDKDREVVKYSTKEGDMEKDERDLYPGVDESDVKFEDWCNEIVLQ
ncbi:uncharacterized protein LOC115887721 [Sitophilus oryzae]|uniref:Uncharacterized protein LOC115887721 n=1 Tax=Sitophilus oryzae TaxID=7048 RepID=A0A6J2YJL2_SITOR|nr:uncharacterized protein LOC115887721 [Sitophilus oryzae]